jgi:SAM-dependent methyltransferase
MKFAVSSCDRMPFKEQMFEVITVCAAYHHFSDTKAFAKEVHRLLKPQGMLYIAEPYYPFIIRAICNPFVPLMKAGDVKLYSPREIKANFEALGFKQMRFKREGHIQIFAMQKS